MSGRLAPGVISKRVFEGALRRSHGSQRSRRGAQTILREAGSYQHPSETFGTTVHRRVCRHCDIDRPVKPGAEQSRAQLHLDLRTGIQPHTAPAAHRYA
ncbi:MAG: hypothetical protein AAGJ28_01510 [Pseudomonadota bacterium]